MTYRLICDSCTDLPSELGADPHVKKVPLTIQIGPETVVDGEDFRQGELLQKMRAWPDARSLHVSGAVPGGRGQLRDHPLRRAVGVL